MEAYAPRRPVFVRMASAQPAGILFTPVPGWVHEADWTARTNQPPDDKPESTHNLLIEEQDRPKTAEAFYRTAELMVNASGVQDSGKLTFDFNPEFQQLELQQKWSSTGKEPRWTGSTGRKSASSSLNLTSVAT